MSLTWRIAPTLGGPGINNERFVYVPHRSQHGTGHMWVETNRAYRPHDRYFSGRTQASGAQYEPLNEVVEWSPNGMTMPFIPGRVVYFGNSSGVANIGFTDLTPIPGLESAMAPLTYDSVVIAVQATRFSTSQSYVRHFNALSSEVAVQTWRMRPEYVEISYYTSNTEVDSVARMRPAARIAYLQMFPVTPYRAAWQRLVDRPISHAFSLGVIGEYGVALGGPLSRASPETAGAAIDAIGGALARAEENARRCREAGGIC